VSLYLDWSGQCASYSSSCEPTTFTDARSAAAL